MHDKLSRFVIFTVMLSILAPILAGCGKAMQTPDGLSARQKREQKQGNTGQ